MSSPGINPNLSLSAQNANLDLNSVDASVGVSNVDAGVTMQNVPSTDTNTIDKFRLSQKGPFVAPTITLELAKPSSSSITIEEAGDETEVVVDKKVKSSITLTPTEDELDVALEKDDPNHIRSMINEIKKQGLDLTTDAGRKLAKDQLTSFDVEVDPNFETYPFQSFDGKLKEDRLAKKVTYTVVLTIPGRGPITIKKNRMVYTTAKAPTSTKEGERITERNKAMQVANFATEAFVNVVRGALDPNLGPMYGQLQDRVSELYKKTTLSISARLVSDKKDSLKGRCDVLEIGFTSSSKEDKIKFPMKDMAYRVNQIGSERHLGKLLSSKDIADGKIPFGTLREKTQNTRGKIVDPNGKYQDPLAKAAILERLDATDEKKFQEEFDKLSPEEQNEYLTYLQERATVSMEDLPKRAEDFFDPSSGSWLRTLRDGGKIIAGGIALLATPFALIADIVHRPVTGEWLTGSLVGGVTSWVSPSEEPKGPKDPDTLNRSLDGVVTTKEEESGKTKLEKKVSTLKGKHEIKEMDLNNLKHELETLQKEKTPDQKKIDKLQAQILEKNAEASETGKKWTEKAKELSEATQRQSENRVTLSLRMDMYIEQVEGLKRIRDQINTVRKVILERKDPTPAVIEALEAQKKINATIEKHEAALNYINDKAKEILGQDLKSISLDKRKVPDSVMAKEAEQAICKAELAMQSLKEKRSALDLRKEQLATVPPDDKLEGLKAALQTDIDSFEDNLKDVATMHKKALAPFDKPTNVLQEQLQKTMADLDVLSGEKPVKPPTSAPAGKTSSPSPAPKASKATPAAPVSLVDASLEHVGIEEWFNQTFVPENLRNKGPLAKDPELTKMMTIAEEVRDELEDLDRSLAKDDVVYRGAISENSPSITKEALATLTYYSGGEVDEPIIAHQFAMLELDKMRPDQQFLPPHVLQEGAIAPIINLKPGVKEFFIPLHVHGNHWTLAKVNIGVDNTKIEYFDSLTSGDKNELSRIGAAIGALLAPLGVKGKPLTTITFKEAVKSPQQKNAKDCGVFVCKTAECFSVPDELGGGLYNEKGALKYSHKDIPKIRMEYTQRILEAYNSETQENRRAEDAALASAPKPPTAKKSALKKEGNGKNATAKIARFSEKGSPVSEQININEDGTSEKI